MNMVLTIDVLNMLILNQTVKKMYSAELTSVYYLFETPT